MILTGDCLEILPTLEPESVQMVCTSPPYYGLRDYGTATWEGGNTLHRCDHCDILFAEVIKNGKQYLEVRNLRETKVKKSEDLQPVMRDEIGNTQDSGIREGMEDTISCTQMEQGQPSESMGREEHQLEGRKTENQEWIYRNDLSAGTPKGDEPQIHDGASAGNGKTSWPISGGIGSSPSSERDQRRQPNRELGVNDEENPQRKGDLSPLPQGISYPLTCPKCDGILTVTGCDHRPPDEAGGTEKPTAGQREHAGRFSGKNCWKCGATRIDSQVGLESTPEAYVEKLVAVFREVRRVLRDDGTVWLNLGSSYAGATTSGLPSGVTSGKQVTNRGSYFGDTLPTPLLPVQHERPCDNDGIIQSDSPEIDPVCHRSDDGRQGDYQNHQNRTSRIETEIVSASLLLLPKDHDNEHRDSAEASLGVSRLSFPESTLLSSSDGSGLNVSTQNHGENDLSDGCSRSLSTQQNAHTGESMNGKSLSDGILAFHKPDTELSSKAYQESPISISPNLTTMFHNVKFKPKDLIPIPWMVAMALQADGWFLRSEIIWAKPNPMPESVTDRPTKSHEQIFLLTKSAKYFYDAEAVKEPVTRSSIDRLSQPNIENQVGSYRVPGKTNGPMKAVGARNARDSFKRENSKRAEVFPGQSMGTHRPDREESAWDLATRNRRSVWTISTKPFKEAHFATFPPEIPEICIKAGTSEKGCCPECGSPWERVVEKIGGIKNLKYADTKISATHQGGMATTTLNATPAQSLTTGWRPTCTHYPQAGEWREYIKPKDSKNPTDGEIFINEGIKDLRERLLRVFQSYQTVPCVVLDPFSGAGTTGLVAEKLGRKYIGIELNPAYSEMGEKRTDEARLPLFREAPCPS